MFGRLFDSMETFDVELMQSRLKDLGFSSVQVEKTNMILIVDVSWKACKTREAEEPPKKRARGMTQVCGICAETRPMIAMAPCGHVLCDSCNETKQGSNCPFCRSHVSCVTTGLFMSEG